MLSGGITQPHLREPDAGSYYVPFHGAFFTLVDDDERKPGAAAHEQNLYLETAQKLGDGPHGKTTEILKGPFGSIDAVRECFYTRPIRSTFGSVSVEFNGNDKEQEQASIVADPTASLPALSSLSLVRIVRVGPEYAIVSANYERDDTLGSLDYGFAKDGRPGGTGSLSDRYVYDP